MATRNLSGLLVRLRRDAKQQALCEALIVPWSRLQETAEAYVEWHTFVLWVRAITETANEVPEIVRRALEHRCPGFLDSNAPDCKNLDWHALEEWIVAHQFHEAGAKGWLTALTYYAHNDLRTEQAWTVWERSKAAWSSRHPARWPTFDGWTASVIATHTLSQVGTEKARAVEAMANVDPARLRSAVSDLLESRAFAIWLGCVSRPQQHRLSEFVMTELRRRCPGLVAASGLAPNCDRIFFVRLVRFGDARWRAVARQQGWMPALRYHVLHHPRYRRLIHYRERCLDEWSQTRPISYPPFTEWLAAADAYYVGALA